MATIGKNMTVGTFPLEYERTWRDTWRLLAHRRLTEVFEAAREIPFDDRSRLIFFSDCHRGSGNRVDLFAPNRALFLDVLTRYYDEGFNYVEVGDGDELWKNPSFRDIRRAHAPIFDLLHRFALRDRLHMIIGNHDIRGLRRREMVKDGLVAEESLVFKHRRTGQRIFVTHGHQADFKSDRLYFLSRFAVKNVWKYIQLLGFGNQVKEKSDETERQSGIDERIIEWAAARRQVTICGHTHQLRSATYGMAPYFNSGSCIVRGLLTGLEIQDGEITPVRWRMRASNGNAPQIVREALAESRRLNRF